MNRKCYKNTILYLLKEKVDYLNVNEIVAFLGVESKRSTLVSIRRSIHNLSRKGIIQSGHILDDKTKHLTLSCWMPTTPNPTGIFTGIIQRRDIENIILRFLHFIKCEFKDTPIVSYSVLSKCVEVLYNKTSKTYKSKSQIHTTFHRALKSLYCNKVIDIVINENNKLITDILLL